VARGVLAKRYAQAVFEIASEKKELDRWQSDLEKVTRLSQDAEILAFLESPKVHFDDKVRLLSQRLGGINPLTLNLVYLLVAMGRPGMIGDIADEYQRLLDSYRGIERAEVATAIPLGAQDKLKLSQRLGALVGKKIVLKAEVDPKLISGMVVRVGGKLLDGSTRSKLAALKRELVS